MTPRTPQTGEYLGASRHANEPETPTLRVLPCVKCGDRHTFDVAAILAEGRASFRGVVDETGQPEDEARSLPDPTEPEVRIWINRGPFLVARRRWTTEELRLLPVPAISEGHDLYEVVPGAFDKVLTDGDSVDVFPELRLFSAPRSITGG